MAQAAVKNIKDASKGGGSKERKSLFSQKVKYAGPTSSLTVYVRETNAGKFKCYALLEKKGSEKKDRGMLTEHATKDEALKKFRELGDQCLSAGWKVKESASKSAFDVIPAAD